MGSIWLRNLPDVLEDLGNVSLYSGWENRSRSSGGYNKLMGIVCHHTASKTSTQSDTTWMWQNSPDKPVGAIYLARDGEIVVGAAGATNCAGKGGPYTTSKGTIPLDSGNSNTISIEAGNNGIGEQWPTAQQDAYVALVAALCEGYGFDPLRDVMSHFEWAPDRKIDPAGSSRYASGANKWNMDMFRGDVEAKMQPSEEEDIVTQEDIDKIARAVWRYQTNEPTVNQPVSTEALLQNTRLAAANADRQTKP
jgi:N-acetyl-anhydromuramyl-L-alanine amidase AmpD